MNLKTPLSWLRRQLSFTTLKGRIAISLSAVVLLFVLLIMGISLHAIRGIEENNLRSTLLFDLDQQSNKLTENYTNMLLISQQMTPQGPVGSLVEDYLKEEKPFSRSMLSREISSAMGQIIFSHPAVELVMYFKADENRAMFNNLPVRDVVGMETLPTLSTNSDISFHPPHVSLCRVFHDQMISITREVTFSNGETWIIYVEARSAIYSDMSLLSVSAGMPYTLTLTDYAGLVRYTSNSTIFRPGDVLSIGEGSPLSRTFRWNSIRSDYGYDTTLWVQSKAHDREASAWRSLLLVVLAIALPAAILIAAVLMQLIYKPLHAFEMEMAKIGEGDLQRVDYEWGIKEFDHLFLQFNQMKHRIQQLLLDVESKEQQKHDLEVEMLSYQINPHFLMNTLNSVHWLAQLHGQPEIDKVICTLNLLLSYNLGRSPEKATLRSEVRILGAYLELQQMRYDFDVAWDVEEGDYLDDPVASFILQPIAENALSHGLDEHGLLEVTIRHVQEDGIIRIILQDDGKGMDPVTLGEVRDTLATGVARRGGGIGLRYVRSVLESHYGDSASLFIDSSRESGTRVVMILPAYGGTPHDPSSDR